MNNLTINPETVSGLISRGEIDPKVTEALGQIRDNGDPLDGDRRFSRNNGLIALAVAEGAAGFPASLNALSTETSQYLFSYPIYVASAAAVAAVFYGVGRSRDSRRMLDGHRQQELIRSYLDEQVDVIRVNKQHHQKELLLRWYGADGLEQPTNSLKLSLEKVVSFAEQTDIEHVAIGSSWLGDRLNQLDSQKDGQLVDGVQLVSNQKKRNLIYAEDLLTDNKVLTATPAQMRHLLDGTRVEQSQSTLGWLVERAGDGIVQSAYQAYLENGKTSVDQFLETVRAALERRYEANLVGQRRPQKDEDGNPLPAVKIFHTSRITNGSVTINDYWSDNDTGRAMASGGGPKNLLSAYGVRTVDDLIDNLKGQSEPDRRAMLTALYLSVYRDKLDEVGAAKLSSLRAEPGDQSSRPFLARMVESESLRTGLALSSHRRYENSCPPTVNYYHGGNHLVRMITGATLMMTALTAGVAAARGAIEIYSNIYNQASDASSQAGQLFASEQTIRGHMSELGRMYYDSFNSLADADMRLSYALASQYIKLFGPLNSVDGEVSQGIFDNWINKTLHDPPAGVYTGEVSQTFTGDVNIGQNKTVYSVTSLSGLPEPSYWYGNEFNLMGYSNYNLGFSDDSESYASPVQVSHSVAAIGLQKPDFMVETSYLSSTRLTSAPVPQGGRIVGAMVVDQADPDKTSQVQVLNDPQRGTYYVRVNPINMNQLGINKPVLKYWIKVDKTPSIKAEAPMVLGGGDEVAVAEEIKKALGLSKSATNQEVYEAIKDKFYSFAPLKDAGLTNRDFPGGDSENQTDVIEFGQLVAHLESLNCNLASAEYLLGTVDNFASKQILVTGFHDNGDSKLTQLEAHAWVVDDKGKVIDPTPSRMAPGHEAPNLSPEDGSDVVNNKAGFPYLPTGEALVGAAFLILGFRRRRTILRQIGLAQAALTFALPGIDKTEQSLNRLLYSDGAKAQLPKMPERQAGEVRRSYIANIPEGGFSRKDLTRLPGAPLNQYQNYLAARLHRYDRHIRSPKTIKK